MIRKILVFIFGIMTFIVLVVLYFRTIPNKVSVSIDKCVDGDTAWFLVDGKSVKVRFLGIDAPEVSHDVQDVSDYYGEEASEYLCNKLIHAKDIQLLNDPNSDIYDKYDRMLAWVFVDDVNLNMLMVSKGYASVRYIYDSYLYVDDLCRAQDKAYHKKMGIWKKKDYSDNYCIKH